MTELTPARLLDRSSAAVPASTRAVVTAAFAASTCSAVRLVTSSHACAVTEIGPGSGAARMAVFAASRSAFAPEVMKLTGSSDGGSATSYSVKAETKSPSVLLITARSSAVTVPVRSAAPRTVCCSASASDADVTAVSASAMPAVSGMRTWRSSARSRTSVRSTTAL